MRDKIEAVSVIAGGSLPAVTPHQAAVLGKKLVLTKRYSAAEAMQIHAAAAASSLESDCRVCEILSGSQSHWLAPPFCKQKHIQDSSVRTGLSARMLHLSDIFGDVKDTRSLLR